MVQTSQRGRRHPFPGRACRRVRLRRCEVYDGYISYKSADDYLGDGEKDVLVRVPAGASVSEVGSILLDNDVVKSTKAYNKALRDSESDVTIQAGQYKLKTHMNAAKAVSILDNPDNIQRTRVTLPEA